MSTVIASLKRLVHLLYERLWSMLQTAPPGSLQLTGVLGAAALLVSYYHLKRQQQPREPPASSQQQQQQHGQQQQQQQQGQPQQQQQQQPGSLTSQDAPAAAAAAGAGGCAPAPSSKGASSRAPAPAPALSPLGQSVRARLQGASRVTLSVAGVLTEEWDPAQWAEGAALRPAAPQLLRELARAADVYVLAHVLDDVGQALVTGALEAADLLGSGPGQVKPHKLLFCSTLDGKASMVRQIEPDLHVDGAPATIEALRRFMPRLLLIVPPGAPPLSAPNISSAPTLGSYFGGAA